jgi:hypothetical protein
MYFVLNVVHISLRLDVLVLKVEVNWEDGVLIMQLIQLLRGKKTIYLYKYKYDLKFFKSNQRWKRDESGAIVKNSETKKPILQFVSIKRLDTNEWAIPGVRNLFHQKFW